MGFSLRRDHTRSRNHRSATMLAYCAHPMLMLLMLLASSMLLSSRSACAAPLSSSCLRSLGSVYDKVLHTLVSISILSVAILCKSANASPLAGAGV